jgi:antibiotic biosynthesis monooxygenase (ABM) superfamily enzyme
MSPAPNLPLAPPSVHRRALLTWLGVFPVITLVQWIIGPHVAHWPLVARTFLFS